MSPSENEDDDKQPQDPDPLCLFYFSQPQESSAKKSYLSSTRGLKPSKTQKLAEDQRISPWKLVASRRDQQSSSDDEKHKVIQRRKNKLSRRRKDVNQSRKRKPLRKPKVQHLASYLLGSVQPAPNDKLPSLTNVLETITDAWPDTHELKLSPIIDEHTENPPPMFHILERRRSVPEEIIRQYNVRKERTSESETNATMPEVTPPSSNDNMWDNPAPSGSEKLRSEVFSQPIEEDFWPIKEMIKERSFKIVDDVIRSAEEGSSDSDSDDPAMERFNTIKRAPLRRSSVIDKSLSTESRNERASQNDYYKNGRGILKINEKSSQTGECTCRSNDSETTPSAQEESESGESSETISSPRVCTHPLSSSENQSSDSEDIKCTCAEITSSKGTSTDPFHSGKSTLSQTVSDKSTSTQDSTASVNSVSSRGSSITAATDSSSTDVDPRTSAKETTTSPDHTPRTPKNNQDNNDRRRDSHRRHCPQHKPQRHSKGGQTEGTYKTEGQNYKANATPRVYEWAQLSQEELNIIQKQLHTKFLENGRNFQSPQPISNNLNVSTRSGSSYQDTEILDDLPLMIPRYSALPRSMSMVVNSSSQDASHYSDSDCQSLADSLEDGNNNCTTYFDTKQESKPVRGDIELALAERTKKTNTKRKEPKGRAYFFSIDNQGEAELVTNIHKIPEPPKTIKNKIHKRHASLSKRIESKEPSEIIKPKFKKPDRPKKENLTPPTVRINDKKLKETETKISTPIEQKPKPSPKIVKTAPSEENQNQEAETPRKPQAVIHPSQQTQSEDVPSTVDMESINHQRQSLINSLESTANVLRAQPKQWQRNQQPVKRVSKFQQRFEVIPEERSSSLTSSAEDPRSEKNRRLSLPVKLTENVNNSTFLNPKSGEKSFRRYTLGSIPKSVISQLMGRPLQAIPCVQRGPNNENQQIIIFSPKDPPGSSKGRDALLAMNREDFNRLSKGWMNFYLLKESSDSDNEVNPDENDQEQEPNTLVCRIPSMEKDPPTTSGSGTDETSISPRRNQQSTKSYSFLLKNLETNCFQLEEVEDSKPNEPISKALSLISEEPEPSDESTYKDASTEIDNTLKKTPKISTKEASTSTERKPKSRPQETSIKLSAPLKLGSSNTVLTTKKAIKVSPRKTPKTSERACSLPELKTETTKKPSPAKTQSMVDPLPRVSGGSPDDSDSDSTIYLNAPSPQVPRLPIEDCCDFYSDSSSSGSTRATNHAPREKAYVPLRRRPLPFRPKNRFVSESVRGKKPGWSVTVEGTLAFPITRPDVQMRLSFPREAGQPFVSQSDSGFVEDREVVSRTVNQKREQWTVTVKNPPSGSGKEHHKTGCHLPNLKQHPKERSISRGPKVQYLIGACWPNLPLNPLLNFKLEQDQKNYMLQETPSSRSNTQRTDINKKLSKIWPKVQKIIETELKTITGDLLLNKNQDEPLISVEGRAMSLDIKPRAPKMSQRDLTRNNTSRSDNLKK